MSLQVIPHSTAFRLRPIHEEVGFDYAQAIRELNHAGLSYERLAEICGFKSPRSIGRLLSDEYAEPSHRAGEAIWAAYVELFGRRPPIGKKMPTP